jgi:ATP-dependent Clp protease ATP-binding subunit ClpC
MEQVPISTGIFIFASGLVLGFVCGMAFGGAKRPSFIAGGEVLNNFSPRAQQVISLARKEADRFNHNFIGTEHLLLGLINLRQGTAVAVLKKIGVDLDKVRMEVERLVGTGPEVKMFGDVPITPRVKKVLSLALAEAKGLNHPCVGTEHILLGLLREGDGVAARVLKNLKVDIDQTRQEILKELDPNIER